MADRAPKRGRVGSSGSKASQGSVGRRGPIQPLPLKTEGAGSGSHYPDSSVPQAYAVHQRQPSGGFSQAVQSPFVAPPHGKLLLPPLPRPQTSTSTSNKDKNRTAHACDKCRKAKAKCSGGQPCDKCRNENKDCIYGDGKRDKEKKEMNHLQKQCNKIQRKNELLVSTLRSFARSGLLDIDQKKQLDQILASPSPVSDDDDDQDTNVADTKDHEREPSEESGEDLAFADVGSTGSLDVIHEDTNRDAEARAAGFLGKSSAVSWAQRAKQEAVGYQDKNEKHPHLNQNGQFRDSAYHAEASDFPPIDIEVNPLEWPPPDLADILVEKYFEHIHVAFPVFSKQDFMLEYSRFPREPEHLDSRQQTWLSILNLVFAISSKFAHLSHADYRGDDRDHLIYYTRARQLGIDSRSLYGDPEVGNTSCLAVLGLYLLTTDQLNRAWTISGIGVRHATALGLHIRSDAKGLCDADKEVRVRLWWSLYSLERLLAELTGRPSCISDRDISTPMPINVDESQFRKDRSLYTERHDSFQSKSDNSSARSSPAKSKGKGSTGQNSTPMTSSSGSRVTSAISPVNSPPPAAFTFSIVKLAFTSSTCFVYRVQLSIISHEILTELYCAALVKSKWSAVQDTIREVDSRLLAWRASLPTELDFTTRSPNPNSYNGANGADDPYFPHRTGLALFYASTRMILFRPCLCRFDGRIEHESVRSKDFNNESLLSCVSSARDVIANLPATPDPGILYKINPYWHTIHYIIEAASVLMLELAYRAEHMPKQAEGLLADSKRAVLWLRELSDESIAARKGWEVFDSLLRQVAPKVGGGTWDMPTEAPIPSGWHHNRFGTDQEGQYHAQQQVNAGVDGTGFHGQQQQSARIDETSYLPAATSAFNVHDPTDAWVDQTNAGGLSLQSGYIPPVTSAAENFLTSLQPFSDSGQVFGRYDEFGPWHNTFFNLSPLNTGPGTGVMGQPMSINDLSIGGQGTYGAAAGRYDEASRTNSGMAYNGGADDPYLQSQDGYSWGSGRGFAGRGV